MANFFNKSRQDAVHNKVVVLLTPAWPAAKEITVSDTKRINLMLMAVQFTVEKWCFFQVSKGFLYIRLSEPYCD